MGASPGPAGSRDGETPPGRAGRTGTWLVLLMALFAGLSFLLFRWYGERALEARGPETPFRAVRELIEADNTLVGLLGGIRRVEPLEVVGANDPAGAAVSALAVGSRDSARVYVDLVVEDDRWTVVRASARLADDRRLPLEGTERPLLEPARDAPDVW